MAIPDRAQANFATLLRAAEAGELALRACDDALTGARRYVLRAVAWNGDAYATTPFGHLADGDPFAAYRPPD